MIGALAADRIGPFTPEEQRVLEALAGEVTRAVQAERLLGAVRREKEEKQRFFHALEELNKTTTPQQAAETAVSQARQMCPARLRRDHVPGAPGGGGGGRPISELRHLSFADNAGW